jgi:hypothetical protein
MSAPASACATPVLAMHSGPKAAAGASPERSGMNEARNHNESMNHNESDDQCHHMNHKNQHQKHHHQQCKPVIIQRGGGEVSENRNLKTAEDSNLKTANVTANRRKEDRRKEDRRKEDRRKEDRRKEDMIEEAEAPSQSTIRKAKRKSQIQQNVVSIRIDGDAEAPTNTYRNNHGIVTKDSQTGGKTTTRETPKPKSPKPKSTLPSETVSLLRKLRNLLAKILRFVFRTLPQKIHASLIQPVFNIIFKRILRPLLRPLLSRLLSLGKTLFDKIVNEFLIQRILLPVYRKLRAVFFPFWIRLTISECAREVRELMDHQDLTDLRRAGVLKIVHIAGPLLL